MNELTEFSQQCTREAQLELFFPFHEGAELREMQRLAPSSHSWGAVDLEFEPRRADCKACRLHLRSVA